jgi:hypothetical protein
MIAFYRDAYARKDPEAFRGRQFYFAINKAFLNFLSSARSYLDFMERLVKSRPEDGPDMAAKFKGYCAAEFDGYFSYRFLYKLRNYAQHKGMPINVISFGQNRSNTTQRGEDYFEVGIMRDRLLGDFDWRKLNDEIKGLPEFIDIVGHTAEFFESLRRIQLQVVGDLFQFHSLADAAAIVIKYAARAPAAQDRLMVYQATVVTATRTNYKEISVPVRLARRIINGNFEDLFTAM